MGTRSQQSLSEYVQKVQNFVELTKANKDYPHKVLELEIESFALKKQLAKELQELYKDQKVIFTEYKKGTSTFLVRKFNQKNPAREQERLTNLFAAKFAKPAPEHQKPLNYPECIDARYAAATVLYQDDKCIAFQEPSQPVAKVHFIVAPKGQANQKSHLTKFSDVGDPDAALMGHLMFVVSKVAAEQGLTNGYRTVINEGQSAAQTTKHLLIHVIGGE